MTGQVRDFDLIKLVQTYPVLYDKDLARGIKNAELKDLAWKEVASLLNASERACITRWKSIRDRFGKECRRVQENPDAPTNWDIFPELLFLSNHYKQGNATNEQLMAVRYEPKERKRKRCRRNGSGSQAEDDSNSEEEIDPDELLVTQRLIALVKENSVLYDKHKIRNSKNVTAKNAAWQEISAALGFTEEDTYMRWKKLRDRFARECRYNKISPKRRVSWVYYEDLLFLEEHYRKGIPLNVEALKRKSKGQIENMPSGSEELFGDGSEDQQWYDGSEDQLVCSRVGSLDGIEIEDNEMEGNSIEQFVELETESLDELLMGNCDEECGDIENVEHIEQQEEEAFEPVQPEEPEGPEVFDPAPLEESGDPEEKLQEIICNMETVMQQSKDALQALVEQKQRHKEELEANTLATQPNLLQKVHILLEGLSASDRNLAERKIVRFLCECQIKALNNEEIEDLEPVQI